MGEPTRAAGDQSMTAAKSEPFQIMLVEDELADAELVRYALTQGKIFAELHHVVDGVAALAYLESADQGQSGHPRPDLILLDLNMPRMDGPTFLGKLRADARWRTIPVVVLTTSEVERDVQQAYGLGANSFITKPVDVDHLFHAIRTTADYWFGVVRLPNG
ncbi:MAG: response regulator [Actinomycetota bacterium]